MLRAGEPSSVRDPSSQRPDPHRPADYASAGSSSASSLRFGIAPTTFLAIAPSLKRIIVGIERTSYWAAVCWFSSTLIETILRSSRSASISSRTGWTTRQGPHQGAQKSTRTGPSASSTSALKVASVTSVNLPVTVRSPGRSFASAQYFRKYSAPLQARKTAFAPSTQQPGNGIPWRVTNAEIAAALEELGVLYELDGADRYRVLAYGTAAKAIRESPVSVAELAAKGKATDVPGVGKTLAEKINALLETGEIPAAVKLMAKFPPTLIEVTRVPGVGPKTARRLFEELDIASMEDLKAAAEGEKIRDVKGLGAKAEENILASLERLGEPGEGPGRLLLSKVKPIAEELAAALREHPAANRVEVAGSVRRWAETCKDIDIIATAEQPVVLAEHLATHPLVAAAGTPGPNGVRAQTHNGVSVDLRIVPPSAFGNLLQHFTGSKAHNVQLRRSEERRVG